MRFVVLDASVAVKWYLNEPGRDEALSLLANDDLPFLAPDVFLAEVVNALLRRNRQGEFEQALLDAALADLVLTSPRLISSAVVMARAVEIASRLQHPIYDCLYLALAERWDTVFITADLKFVQLCRNGLVDDPAVARLRMLGDLSSA